MNKLMIGFVAAMSLMTFGCKKKGGAAGEAMAKMEEFSKKMCDCKDKACADKVNEEMTKWGTEMAKNAKPGDAEKPDPDMAKKSADIMQKYTECMTKNMMAGGAGSAKAEEPKKEEPKKEDAPKEEPKKEEPKKEEEKKEEEKK